MKRTDLKENSNVFFIGKGFVILAILITSSLSFTLGYFVGKSVRTNDANETLLTPVIHDNTEQKNIVTEDNNETAQLPEQITEPQQTIQPKETKLIEKPKDTKIPQETQNISKVRKYTVQAGAFKNASDADVLKARLDKKGYKTFVIPADTKKHEKLYKIMVGDFSTRKEAEILSVKIKKSEGLNTFVTFKTEQED